MPTLTGVIDASKSHERYATCPKCHSADLRGPHDSEPNGRTKHFTRAWFCRVCWWSHEITLRDDSAVKDAGG
jgi:hypothetical protein